MILLDTTVDVPADRRLVVDLPPGTPAAAAVRIVVTDAAAAAELIASEPAAPTGGGGESSRGGPWPTVQPGPRGTGFDWLVPWSDFGRDWDPAETFRREDMYGDDGR